MSGKLKVLDLFSGIGGFSLGLERTGGFETVAFCEIEEFPRKVLKKHWPNTPIHRDVRKLRGEDVGPIDVICGGYPCQPFSTAGRRKGKKDDRHLWPEFNRLVAELRPAWVIGENVAGHVSMGLDDVLSDLEGQGYTARTFIIPACAVNAPHRRDRVWVVAHSPSVISNGGESGKCSPESGVQEPAGGEDSLIADPKVMQRDGGSKYWEQSKRQEFKSGKRSSSSFTHPTSKRQQRQGQSGQPKRSKAFKHREADQPISTVGWPTEPAVCGADDGVSDGVDRLKSLGNAVVPQIPEIIGRAILDSMQD